MSKLKFKFKVVHGRVGSDIWANSRLKVVGELVKGKNNRILDLGCGPGYMGALFARENNVLFGDYDAKNLVKINGEGIVLDGKRLPFKDDVFDYVICADVLEHIDEDDKVLENIYRVIKRGGKAIITVPAYKSLYGTHDKLIGHFRRYDKDEFVQLARSKGYHIKNARFVCSLMYPIFAFSNMFSKQTRTYTGQSRIEHKIIPILNAICELDKKIILPFGIGLLFILEK